MEVEGVEAVRYLFKRVDSYPASQMTLWDGL